MQHKDANEEGCKQLPHGFKLNWELSRQNSKCTHFVIQEPWQKLALPMVPIPANVIPIQSTMFITSCR